MKRNIFISLLIIVKSVFATLIASSKVLLLLWTKKLNRAHGDRIVQSWCEKLLKYVDVDLEIINLHHVNLNDGRRYILMCNHASHYDIPLSIVTFNKTTIRMVAKKELFKIPIWGTAIKVCDNVSIDRNNREQAFKDLQVAKTKMNEGIVIWLAPEGTRSLDGKLLPFKKGGFNVAIESKATIVPLSIKGANKILPAKSLRISTGETVKMIIGKPIDASQYTLAQRNDLLLAVRAEIENNLA